MGIGSLLGMIFSLAIHTVLAIQKVHGDVVAGKDKKTMAHDALDEATAAALETIGEGQNKQLAEAASEFAGTAIDQAVAVTKIAGTYQKATAAAAAALADTAAAVPAIAAATSGPVSAT